MNSLSQRQLDVLQSFAEGLVYKEVAAKLGIASSTVKCHVIQIRGKLAPGKNIAAAITAAFRAGILK